MNQWYYARNGQQSGPVGFEEIASLVRSGGLDPAKDLVWNASMKDWLPAGQVPEIAAEMTRETAPAADPSNPYAAPATTWTSPATPGEALEEIVPGSDPINVGGCVKRGFDLTIRHFSIVLVAILVYLGVSIVAEILLGLMDSALGLERPVPPPPVDPTPQEAMMHEMRADTSSWLNILLGNLLSIFLSLGITRFGLDLVSGRQASIGMLFSGGRKLLPAFVATILYTLMVLVGFVLLIVPGIYLAIRYGMYLTAMVDCDLGIIDSFKYSSKITTGNRMNLFLLLLLTILIVLAGVVALCVGLLFALPVAGLAWIVAYRWLQYGHRAALDHPGTTTPMLTGTGDFAPPTL